jgi:tetratricopeptide (TPR) repeat protein
MANGDLLFEALFPPEVLRLYERSLEQAKACAATGLRLKLMLDPSDPDLEGLLDLPWEALRQPGTPNFLALSRYHSIVRYLMVPRPVQATARPRVLRILSLAVSPRGLPPLDLARERRNLAAAFEKASGIELVEAAAPTLKGLRQELLAHECHCFHFIGHGSFEAKAGGGVLYLETENGQARPVSGEELANTLAGFPSLRLVVLNACKSARNSEAAGVPGDIPFGGVATALVQGGLPAVIAMRSSISDPAAIAFSETFYQRLTSGDPVDAAIAEGRQAIYAATDSAARESHEWGAPALFMRTTAGELFPTKDLPPERYPQRSWWSGWLMALVLMTALVTGGWYWRVGYLNQSGSTLLLRGDKSEAQTKFQEALRLAPRSSSVHNNLAEEERLSGDMDAAERDYRAALATEAGNLYYLHNFASFLNERNRFDEAFRLLRAALRPDREHVKIYIDFARAAMGERLFHDAVEALEVVLRLDPGAAAAYSLLGQMALLQGDFGSAKKDLREAIDNYQMGDSGRTEALSYLVEVSDRIKDGEVCQNVQRFREEDPEGITPWASRVDAIAKRRSCYSASRSQGDQADSRAEIPSGELIKDDGSPSSGIAQEADLTGLIAQVDPSGGRVELKGPGVGTVPVATLGQVVRSGVEFEIPKGIKIGVICSIRRFLSIEGPASWSLSREECLRGKMLPLSAYSLMVPRGGRLGVVPDVFVLEEKTRGDEKDRLAPIIVGPRSTVLREPRPYIFWLQIPSAVEYKIDWAAHGQNAFVLRLDAKAVLCRLGWEGLDICYVSWPAEQAGLAPGQKFSFRISARDTIKGPWHESASAEVRTMSRGESASVDDLLRDLEHMPLKGAMLEAAEAGLLAEEGLLADAAEKYRGLVESDLTGELEVTLADAYLRMGVLQLAEIHYKKAAEAPKPVVHAASVFGLGRIDFSRDRYAQAAANFREAEAIYGREGLEDERRNAESARGNACGRMIHPPTVCSGFPGDDDDGAVQTP